MPASKDALAALLAHCSSLVSFKVRPLPPRTCGSTADKAATLIPLDLVSGGLQVPMLCSASLKALVQARGGCLRELDLSDHELTDDLTPLVCPSRANFVLTMATHPKTLLCGRGEFSERFESSKRW